MKEPRAIRAPVFEPVRTEPATVARQASDETCFIKSLTWESGLTVCSNPTQPKPETTKLTNDQSLIAINAMAKNGTSPGNSLNSFFIRSLLQSLRNTCKPWYTNGSCASLTNGSLTDVCTAIFRNSAINLTNPVMSNDNTSATRRSHMYLLGFGRAASLFLGTSESGIVYPHAEAGLATNSITRLWSTFPVAAFRGRLARMCTSPGPTDGSESCTA